MLEAHADEPLRKTIRAEYSSFPFDTARPHHFASSTITNMAWTVKHVETPFEQKLTQLGCAMRAAHSRVRSWRKSSGQNGFPNTNEDMKEVSITMEDINVLEAIEQEAQAMSTAESDTFEFQLARGAQEMEARFRIDTTLPYVPKVVSDSAFTLFTIDGGGPSYDYDEQYAMELYPGILDEITAKALYHYSDNDHVYPHAMYAIAAFWTSEGWNDAQLAHWFIADGTIQSFDWCPLLMETCREFKAIRDPSKIKFSRETYADLLALLARCILHYDFEEAVHLAQVEHTGYMIKELPLQVLQRHAKEAGLPFIDNKANLIIALLEHIYSDVLEPRWTLGTKRGTTS